VFAQAHVPDPAANPAAVLQIHPQVFGSCTWPAGQFPLFGQLQLQVAIENTFEPGQLQLQVVEL